ncbi:MarR family winged helix-turn-helix transcriptional regulator [Streptomonospora litoralis]|uniref:MarR family winged helix-turn-helix transcriptional regulator n=1 Tax=Streptomonospora litoralis TaxID=2498135 RepID=UPI001F61938C|nr:MarR family transcriptional regulator [Streptomonospora litoralis]
MGNPLNLPFDPIGRAHDNWTRRWGANPSMAAVTSIMRAQQILIGQLDAALKPYELTFARYEALVLLTFSSTGELPLGKIGERLMVHPTSVTNTIDRLERQGFVYRKPNPSDGRGTLAEITDSGREVVEQATRDLVAMDFGLDCYSDEEAWRIHEIFAKLRVEFGDFPAAELPGEEAAAERPSTGETGAR